ncbi:hypothetical protein Hamer_G014878 [Homarus americanus]|uniref:Uncharacterized protein n=1 Tax=Homarus americanus TaxID=6706 RepID=A0A8J5MNK6_HOMAM|nr:hypothetical protein Hamer_G014878 [Homarus americanus]
MEVPDWPSYAHSVERCVKLVTEAAAHVYSHEKRDGMVKSQLVSRLLVSRNRSKQDLASLTKFKRQVGATALINVIFNLETELFTDPGHVNVQTALMHEGDHNTAKILSEVTNLNGKTVKIIPLDPEEKTTRMVLLRYPLELPVEVIIKHPKVTKAERCVTSQDKAQTRQVLVDIKGTVPEEVDHYDATNVRNLDITNPGATKT